MLRTTVPCRSGLDESWPWRGKGGWYDDKECPERLTFYPAAPSTLRRLSIVLLFLAPILAALAPRAFNAYFHAEILSFPSVVAGFVVGLSIAGALALYAVDHRWIRVSCAIAGSALLFSLVAPTLAYRNYESGRAPRQTPPQILLERALELKRDERATLSGVTARLVGQGQPEVHLGRVPEEADWLRFSVGADQGLAALGVKSTVFDLVAVGPEREHGSQSTRRVRRVVLEIPKKKAWGGQWFTIELDLANARVEAGDSLLVRKTANLAPGRTAETPVELTFLDFMHVSAPKFGSRRSQGQPNVILISLDTVRADFLHLYGSPYETSPNLEAVAERGFVFTRAISQAPWTAPSHTSILTGLYPRTSGSLRYVQEGPRGWTRGRSLSETLSEVGYATVAFTAGGATSPRYGFSRGFDTFDVTRPRPRGSCGATEVETISRKAREWIAAHSDLPFLMFAHTYEAHWPYCSPAFLPRWTPREMLMPSKDKSLRYAGDVLAADRLVGAIHDALVEAHLEGETLLVVTSDHGEDLGEGLPEEAWIEEGHGFALTERQLWVPLVLRLPESNGQREPLDWQVRLVDITPTIVDFLGVDTTERYDGRSLLPMIFGREEGHRPAFSEATTYGADRVALSDGQWRVVERTGPGMYWHPTSRGLPFGPAVDFEATHIETDRAVGAQRESRQERSHLLQLLSEILQRDTLGTHSMPPDHGQPEMAPQEMEELEALGYL